MQERGTVAPVAAGRSRWVPIFAGASVVVALDQLTKWWALERLSDGRTIDIVGSLRFNLVLNPGGAFSIGRGATGVFIVFGLAMLGGLLWWSRYAESTAAAVGIGLIIGGASGNLSDRLFRDLDGKVVDFIDLQWWPVFNVADIGLFCGVALFAWSTLREPARSSP